MAVGISDNRSDGREASGHAVAADYAFVLEDGGWLLERLAQRAFEDPSLFLLNRRVADFALIEGFDKLLSLGDTAFTPFPYQVETALTVLRRFRGRALLCDEVGLGKTIEAGLVLKEYVLRGLARKVLILTPPALVSQWREELASKFRLEFITSDDPNFRASGPEAWAGFDRVIASLNTARMAEHARAIHAQRYDLVIVDEAHHLKARTTQSWKFVNQLDKQFILLLTATPIQNSLEELFNLVTILKPGQLSTLQMFKKQFVTRGDPRLPKNRARLQELLFDAMVRNTRGQVGVSLPKRHATTLRLSLTPPERELYDRVTAFVRTEHPRVGVGDKGINRFTLELLQQEIGSSSFAVVPTLAAMAENPHNSTEQRQQIGSLLDLAQGVQQSARAAALLKLLKATSEKVVVFTRFRETLRYLSGVLREAGISTALYHGRLSVPEKNQAIVDFEGPRQVLLCTEAAGEGRNLQFCSTMVNYDLPWNPMRIEQRVGRIHRIGQERDVHIYNLSALGTIEDYMLWLLDSKINMFELVIGEMDMILGNLAGEGDFAGIVSEIWLRSRDEAELAREVGIFGDDLIRAKQEYLKAREYDSLVFGQDYRVTD